MSADGAPPKVIYLAIDACDAGLMQEMARGGLCPHLAGLLDTGAVFDTVAPYGTFVGSSWMTISTGTAVGTHQFWNWLTVDPASHDLRSTDPRDVGPPRFWQHLSDAGRRVAVLDVPHAVLPSELNGVLLKEWGCHDRHHGTASHPPELLQQLDETIGRHPYGCMDHPGGEDAFAPCDYAQRAGSHRTLDEERQLVDLIRRSVAAKRAASLSVLDQGGWDLFATVLGEAHCVGHQLWHVHDDTHPRHDVGRRRVLGDPVTEIYQELDDVLGEHLARATPDTTVWVQLNHGMGPHYDGDHLLDEILLRIDRADAGAAGTGWRTRLAARVLERAPQRLRTELDRAAALAVRRRAASAPPALCTRTGPRPDRRLFQIPGNTAVGAVRFSVVGREAHGLVPAGPELDRLTQRVAASLLALVNVDTGRPAVRAVVRSDDVLQRSPGDGLPDMFVEWDRSAPVDRVWSADTGTVAGWYDNWRTGDHNDRGLVVVRGPGVAPGRRPAPMSLVDVAPTVCATLDAELPTTDGHVHTDLLPGRPAGPLAPTGVRALAPDAGPAPRRPSHDLEQVAGAALDLSVATARRLDELSEQLAAHGQAADHWSGQVHDLARRVRVLERESLVWSTTAWLAHEDVVETDLITVILPTHERPEQLRRAVASVLAQRYPHWELVLVDDGGEVAKAVAAEVGDDRITAIAVPHGGVCAARNAGLSVAQGSIVTYLDDDNALDPGWLHAVSWGFANHPHADVLFGARAIDDWDRVHGRGVGGWPWIQFNAFDRAALEHGNFADMGVIAHRAGLPAARFDESLWECGDWDFLLALTEEHDPVALPAIALYYRTDGDDRLTGRYADHEQVVRQKWADRRAERERQGRHRAGGSPRPAPEG